jgi:transcriptional regulator with XRE-family HTH domain
MRPLLNPPEPGQLVREYREQAGLTQEALAAKAGVHRTYIGFLERGERKATVTTLTRILDALGLKWVDFGKAMDIQRGGRS